MAGGTEKREGGEREGETREQAREEAPDASGQDASSPHLVSAGKRHDGAETGDDL